MSAYPRLPVDWNAAVVINGTRRIPSTLRVAVPHNAVAKFRTFPTLCGWLSRLLEQAPSLPARLAPAVVRLAGGHVFGCHGAAGRDEAEKRGAVYSPLYRAVVALVREVSDGPPTLICMCVRDVRETVFLRLC
jgi:hypothetical protein